MGERGDDRPGPIIEITQAAVSGGDVLTYAEGGLPVKGGRDASCGSSASRPAGVRAPGLHATTLLRTLVPVLDVGQRRDAERAAARAAGWRRCDLEWERLQERALAALRSGDPALASRCWRLAGFVARLRFRRNDPRYVASLANLGLVARLAGQEELARRRYAAALRLWGAVPEWIGGMAIARRGRSSLFHLQMERAHWGAYERSLRNRAAVLAQEAAFRMDAASRSRPLTAAPNDRWPGEKPAVFDDLRKFLSAALLIAADAQSPARRRAPSDIDA